MSLLFSTGLMKWRLCIAIAEPQQSYPAAKKPETDADTTRCDIYRNTSGKLPDSFRRPESFRNHAFHIISGTHYQMYTSGVFRIRHIYIYIIEYETIR